MIDCVNRHLFSFQLWEYNRGIVVAQGSEHASAVKSVAFSPCGKFFVTGCSDGCIIIWDVPGVNEED